MTTDRFGMGWRPDLAAGILANLDRVDIVEVIADDFFDAPKHRVSMLRTLSSQVSVLLHGVTMGLASTVPVAEHRLVAMARLFELIRPESWSEHLAFVRGGGVEIGHLAAPPRSSQVIEGASRNFRRAREIVGTAPYMENVATLFDPPASTMDEAEWLSAFVSETGSDLLLDLHNLYANAVNFGVDPHFTLDRLPLANVSIVHISGGHWINESTKNGSSRQRLLDDHVHDVPDPVFDLLESLCSKVKHPITVVLERDGLYPSFDHLLKQLERARSSVTKGRRVSPKSPEGNFL
jgi:uncharacterized protein (UPF0276 family)